MPVWLHRLGSPPYFYARSIVWVRWLAMFGALFMMAGLIGGLVLAPTDFEQGESY